MFRVLRNTELKENEVNYKALLIGGSDHMLFIYETILYSQLHFTELEIF